MISVVIPTYNREKTIKKAVDSVLSQTYKDIELIVVDDCSNDKTGEIISKINDVRLRYIRLEKNSGANYARNIGIFEANGEYIAFQDSDDVWRKEKLERELEYLVENDCDVVFCSMLQHHNDRKDIRFPRINDSDKKNLARRVLFGNIMSTQTILAKKELIKKEKFDNSLERFQDWDLAIRLLNKYNVEFLDKVLVDVYVGEDSISKSSTKAVKSLSKIIDKYPELLESKSVNDYLRLYLLKYAIETKNEDVIRNVIVKNWQDCKSVRTLMARVLGVKVTTFLYHVMKMGKDICS